MNMRRIQVGIKKITPKVPDNLKPWKSLKMFRNIDELKKEAKRLQEQKKEVRIVESTLTLNYR